AMLSPDPDAADTDAIAAAGPLEAVATADGVAADGVAADGAGDFTLPTLQQSLENIGRSVTAAQMSLAGHAVTVYENPSERQRLLGLPPGKTAFRDGTDYLKIALRIDATEARRRIRWAATLRPTQTLSGDTLPPRLPLLSEAVQDGAVDRSAVDVITQALDTARQMARRVDADAQTVGTLLEDGEQRLVSQALWVDP